MSLPKCPKNGKTSYPSEDFAAKVAAKRFRKGGPICRPYCCGMCHNWHLTSKPFGAYMEKKNAAGT